MSIASPSRGGVADQSVSASSGPGSSVRGAVSSWRPSAASLMATVSRSSAARVSVCSSAA